MSTTADLGLQGRPSLSAMTRIEARRLARHPAFIIGNLAGFGVLGAFTYQAASDDTVGDLMSWPVVPAFFIGLVSLIAVARLTRSTEDSEEAVATAPGTYAFYCERHPFMTGTLVVTKP